MTRNQSAATSPKTARGLPTGLLLWLSCGTVGSLLFMATYLIEGATRPGYNAWQQAISALSLGLDGWVQQVNFVAFGAITVSTAIGWRQFLTGGMGATWYPILRSLVSHQRDLDHRLHHSLRHSDQPA